jgi:hypothetical protein
LPLTCKNAADVAGPMSIAVMMLDDLTQFAKHIWLQLERLVFTWPNYPVQRGRPPITKNRHSSVEQEQFALKIDRAYRGIAIVMDGSVDVGLIEDIEKF